jgi:hypothetical protein
MVVVEPLVNGKTAPHCRDDVLQLLGADRLAVLEGGEEVGAGILHGLADHALQHKLGVPVIDAFANRGILEEGLEIQRKGEPEARGVRGFGGVADEGQDLEEIAEGTGDGEIVFEAGFAGRDFLVAKVEQIEEAGAGLAAELGLDESSQMRLSARTRSPNWAEICMRTRAMTPKLVTLLSSPTRRLRRSSSNMRMAAKVFEVFLSSSLR